MTRRDDFPRRTRWPVIGGLVAVLAVAAVTYTAIVYGLACALGGCS